VSSLKTSPYFIPWGGDIFAFIIATNVYGDSEHSDIGNGAKIITYPIPPISLSENYILRASNSITLMWL
jgi:hypothetical protein